MSLDVADVCLTLGDGDQQVQALDHVSLSVEPGELLAVGGTSGSGKSSLLAVVGGLRRPRSGTVVIGGTEITAMSAGDLTRVRRDRIGIARALMGKPDLLLVDEPTSMLDHRRGRQIIELLARQCHEHRVATLMVTHDPGMLDCADRIVSMVDGRLQAGIAPGHA